MITTLIAQFWPYLLGLTALVAGWFTAKHQGAAAERNRAQAKQAESTIKGMKNAIEARDEIDSLDDNAIRNRAIERMRDSAKR